MKQNIFYGFTMIFEQNLPMKAKLIFLYLCKFADRAGKCFPSVRSMSRCCNISKRAIFDYLRFLENSDIVTRDKRFRHEGYQTSNCYQIKPTKDTWCVIPSAIFDIELSPQAKIIYMYFCSMINDKDECFPSRKKIGKACTISQTKVTEALRELENACLIKRNSQFRANQKGQTSNLYTVIDIDCA